MQCCRPHPRKTLSTLLGLALLLWLAVPTLQARQFNNGPCYPAPTLTGACDTASGGLLLFVPDSSYASQTGVTYDLGLLERSTGQVQVWDTHLADAFYAIFPGDFNATCFVLRANVTCPDGSVRETEWSDPLCCGNSATPVPTRTATPVQDCSSVAPPQLQAYCGGPNSLAILRWRFANATSGVTYDVGVENASGGIDVLDSGLTTPTYTVTGLFATQIPCFYVRANFDCQGQRATTNWSAVACCNGTQPTVTPTQSGDCPPPAPILHGDCTSSGTTLNWSVPGSNSISAPTFEVGVQNLDGSIDILARGLTTMTYDVPDVLPAIYTDCFFLRAYGYCSTGAPQVSDWSQPFCCSNTLPTPTPDPSCPPSAPQMQVYCDPTFTFLYWQVATSAPVVDYDLRMLDANGKVLDTVTGIQMPSYFDYQSNATCYEVRANVLCGGAVLPTSWSQSECCAGWGHPTPTPWHRTPTPTPTHNAPNCPPAAPQFIPGQSQCLSPDQIHFDLTWDAVPGASSYEIGYTDSASGATQPVVLTAVPGNQTSYSANIPTFIPVVDPCYFVRAVVPCAPSRPGIPNGNVNTDWSRPFCCGNTVPTFTPDPNCPPARPVIDANVSTCLDFQDQNDTASVTWSAVPGAIEYEVKGFIPYMNFEVPLGSVPGTQTSQRYSTATLGPLFNSYPAVEFCIVVRALVLCNGNYIWTDFSAPFCCPLNSGTQPPTQTPDPNCPPPAPVIDTNTTVCPDFTDPNASFTVNWSAVPGAVEYHVQAFVPFLQYDIDLGFVSAPDTSLTVNLAGLGPILGAIQGYEVCVSVRALVRCNGVDAWTMFSAPFCCQFNGGGTPTATPTPWGNCWEIVSGQRVPVTCTPTPTATPTNNCDPGVSPILNTVTCTSTGDVVLDWLLPPLGAPSPPLVRYDIGIVAANGTIDKIFETTNADSVRVPASVIPVIAIYTDCFAIRPVWDCGNAEVEGTWSNIECCTSRTPLPTATPDPNCPPAAPTLLANASRCPDADPMGQLHLEWQAVSGAREYEISVDLFGQRLAFATVPGTDNTFTIDPSPFLPLFPAGVQDVCVVVRAKVDCSGVETWTGYSQPFCCNLGNVTPGPTNTPTPTPVNCGPAPVLDDTVTQCYDSAGNPATTFDLAWNALPSGLEYEIGVSYPPVLNDPIAVETVQTNSATITLPPLGPLFPGAFEVCFHVRAKVRCQNTIGWTDWSAPICCDLNNPGTPAATNTPTPTPANCNVPAPSIRTDITDCPDLNNPQQSVTVGWTAVPRAIEYDVAITADPLLPTPMIIITTNSTQVTFDVASVFPFFPSISEACVLVRAKVPCQGGVGYTDWSSPFCCSFTGSPTPTPSANCPTAAPRLAGLLDNAGVLTLQWNDVSTMSARALYDVGVVNAMTGAIEPLANRVLGTTYSIDLTTAFIPGNCFVVRARYQCPTGEEVSAWSNEYCANTNPNTPTPCLEPAPVIDSTRSNCMMTAAGDMFVELYWSPVNNAESYEIGVADPLAPANIIPLDRVSGNDTFYLLTAYIGTGAGTARPCFHVRANVDCGNGTFTYTDWSQPFCCSNGAPTATPTPSPTPGCPSSAPILSGSDALSGFFELAWTADPAPTGSAVVFDIGVAEADGSITELFSRIPGRTFSIDPNMMPLPTNCFAVRARYSCDPSGAPTAWSNVYCFSGQVTPRPTATPGPCNTTAPNLLTNRSSCNPGGSVTLSWDPVPGAITYEIGYADSGDPDNVTSYLTTLYDTTATFRAAPATANLTCYKVRAKVPCNGRIIATDWSTGLCCNSNTQPTFTPTPLPNSAPFIRTLTAYNAGVSHDQGGAVQFEAWVEDPDGFNDIQDVELLLQDTNGQLVSTSIYMDAVDISNGYFTMNIVLTPGVDPGNYILKFRPLDGSGNQGNLATYILRVAPSVTTRSATTGNYQIRETYIRQDYVHAGLANQTPANVILAMRAVDQYGNPYQGDVQMLHNGLPVGMHLHDQGDIGDTTGDGIYSVIMTYDGASVMAPTSMQMDVGIVHAASYATDYYGTNWPIHIEVY